MSGKKFAGKALSVLICMAMVFSVLSGFSLIVSAADYNWSANWRYKTEEGGDWNYPASDKDVFYYYSGEGYFWADFDGDTPTNFNMGSTGFSHPGMQVNAGSTLIITASSFYNNDPEKPTVYEETKFYNNLGDNNLMQTKGGTIIIGEGVWLEKTWGKSAISLEDTSDSCCYVAGRLSCGSWGNGVWTDKGGAFHRLGRDNPNTNSGGMVYNDYYKGYINKGDHVTSVDEGDYLFKGREFEQYLAQGDHYYLAGADHEISCEIETGYHFTNWTGAATLDTQTATFNFSGFDSRTLTANTEINRYTVTFVSGATNEVLKEETGVAHGSAATAPTAPAHVDINNPGHHERFTDWDCDFSSVTGDMTVTALYEDEGHTYSMTGAYNTVDHTIYCSVCGNTRGENHTFDSYTGLCACGYESPDKADYTAVDSAIEAVPGILVYYSESSVDALNNALGGVERNLYAGRQSDVNGMAADINNAVAGLTVRQYNVSVSGDGCTISQYLPSGSHYYLATVRAPKLNSAGEYFTYWVDGDGDIVGTYRNYSFYVVKDITLTAVFTPYSNYEEARQPAVISSRALDAKSNGDGTVVVFGEHSISSTEGSINGHGMLVTANSSLATDSNLVRGAGNDDIFDFMAATSNADLTGILEGQATLTGDAVYVRTYVIDKEGTVKYGDIKSYAVSAGTSSVGDEIVFNSESFDLTALNEGGDSPAEAVEEPAEQEGQDMISVLIEMLTTIFTKIINYVKLALSILK